ncbi:MAG: pre-peptidase C-terminal domain-containing protein [Chloroflexi bacterium]|nr:pre-peptidase C-terminal domain-containing protein [Chloroflexota bacterium]
MSIMGRLKSFIALVLLTLIIQPILPVAAQDSTSHYENVDMGVSFDIPADWTVRVDAERLTAATQTDLDLFTNNQFPQGLIFSIVIGSYNGLGLQNAAGLPDQLVRLAPSGATPSAPESIVYGNATGYQTEFTIPDSGIATRVALLNIAGARLAVVRGLAQESVWPSVLPQFETIVQTLKFTLPAGLTNPFDALPDDDGGVLWQYQSGQLPDEAPITLGGITYDEFGVMYIAAGARGFLALNQATGEFINFIPPIYDNDDYVDVAIGPDARLYFANATERANQRIMVTDRLGGFANSWGVEGDAPGQFAPGMPRSIAVSKEGDVWVISEGHTIAPVQRLYRFDSLGNLLQMIDLDSIVPGMKDLHLANEVNEDRVFVVGKEGGLQMLNWDGTPLITRINEDILDQAVPLDIATGPQGIIVIATQNQGFIQLTSVGELLDRFGIAYDATRGGAYQPGEYLTPTGLAIDRDSIIYFAETNATTGFAQAQAFTFSGDGVLAMPGRSPEVGDDAQVSAEGTSGGPITYGTTVHGVLNNLSPEQDYTFEALPGDQVLITLRDVSTEQTLDTQLILLDVNQNEIANNDDANNPPAGFKPTDSILRFTPGVAGTYIIRVTRFGGNGEYELSLTQE